MTRLTFYFDPLCPWAWLTSLWARELRELGRVEIEWKFLSLAAINESDPHGYSALRVCALARREGGNDAVDRVYLSLGRLFHEDRKRPQNQEDFLEHAPHYLETVGLDPTLAGRALVDESTLDEVVAEYRDAGERLHAFGVPWILIDGQEPGIFGPVINEVPRGDAAVELLEHFAWMDRQPYFFEMKRTERTLPKLKGLSERFDVAAGSPA